MKSDHQHVVVQLTLIHSEKSVDWLEFAKFTPLCIYRLNIITGGCFCFFLLAGRLNRGLFPFLSGQLLNRNTGSCLSFHFNKCRVNKNSRFRIFFLVFLGCIWGCSELKFLLRCQNVTVLTVLIQCTAPNPLLQQCTLFLCSPNVTIS